MRMSLPVMNPPSGPISSAPTAPTSSGVPAPSRGDLDHAPVACPARPAEFVLGQRSHNDPRANRVDPRTTLAPAHRLGHHAQRVPALRELVGVQGVRHLVGLKEGKIEQLFRGRRGQRFVLFDAERGKAMPGLRRYDDPGPTAGDDVAELLQQERRAIQIDFEDRRR
jgi:hypothetical protein